MFATSSDKEINVMMGIAAAFTFVALVVVPILEHRKKKEKEYNIQFGEAKIER